MNKPIDASDIRSSGSVHVAKEEVMRLRLLLGHLAKDAGFAEVIYDASDCVKGVNDNEDFERCVNEIIHIRNCLQLSTQANRRKARAAQIPTSMNVFTKLIDEANELADMDDNDEDDSSDDDDAAANSTAAAGASKYDKNADNHHQVICNSDCNDSKA